MTRAAPAWVRTPDHLKRGPTGVGDPLSRCLWRCSVPRKEGLGDSQVSFTCGGGGIAIYTTGMHGTFCLTEISERGTIPYFGMKVLRLRCVSWW